MTTFRFHWLGGKYEDGKGIDVADAFRRLGYGGSAIAALDWYEVIDPPKVDRDDQPDINNN